MYVYGRYRSVRAFAACCDVFGWKRRAAVELSRPHPDSQTPQLNQRQWRRRPKTRLILHIPARLQMPGPRMPRADVRFSFRRHKGGQRGRLVARRTTMRACTTTEKVKTYPWVRSPSRQRTRHWQWIDARRRPFLPVDGNFSPKPGNAPRRGRPHPSARPHGSCRHAGAGCRRPLPTPSRSSPPAAQSSPGPPAPATATRRRCGCAACLASGRPRLRADTGSTRSARHPLYALGMGPR